MVKLPEYLFILYALVSPISLSATNIVLGIIILSGVAFLWTRNERPEFNVTILIPFLALFIWAALTRMLSGDFSFKESVGNVWEYSPIILFSVLLHSSKVKKEAVIMTLLAVSSLVCLLGIIQYIVPSIVYPFPKQLVRKDFRGFFAHHLHAGGFYSITTVLSFSLALFWQGEKRYYLWLFFLFNLMALFLTMTRSYYISASVILLILLFVKNWRWFLSGSVAFAILFMLIMSFPNPIRDRISTITDKDFASNKARIYIWKAAIEMVKDHPLKGIGKGNWKRAATSTYYPRFEKEWTFGPANYAHAHNVYLTWLAETGIIGLGLFLYFWLTVSWLLFRGGVSNEAGFFDEALRIGTLAGLGNLFVAGMFENNFGTSVVLLLMSFLIGLSLAPSRNHAT